MHTALRAAERDSRVFVVRLTWTVGQEDETFALLYLVPKIVKSFLTSQTITIIIYRDVCQMSNVNLYSAFT